VGRTARIAALQGLALQLAGDGRFEESLTTLQEALALAGRLRFGTAPYVRADIVHTRAHVLFDAGRWAEAAETARASAAARRELGTFDSDQLSRLSDSLELQANALTRLRRLDEADAVSAEVVAMRARLPWADRARALLNRAAVLTDAGRHEEGLAVATELVRSAPTRGGGPDLGDPALVDGLVNLAVLLRLNGRWQDAVSVQALAVDQLRPAAADGGRLAASADLAVALANQSLMHLELGRPDEAEAPGQEALEIRERLARHSAKHLDDLSDSLNNQAIVLDRLGRTEEAEVLASRSVELRRRLHERQPAAHERRLANALGTHSHMLTASGRPEAGVVAGREAVDRLRRLYAGDPVATAPWLAGALDSLAEAGAAAGLDAECLAASREAVDTGRRAARSSPSGFGGTYAEILLECAERCRPIRGADPDECLAWVREAVDLLGVLGADEPEAYELLLERARGVLAGWAGRDEP
jgi:tetratricopeptide (TPR) repeat protein